MRVQIVFTAYIQRYMAKKIDKVVNVRSVRPDPSNRWKRLRNRFHSRGEDDESTHEFNVSVGSVPYLSGCRSNIDATR